MFSQQSLQNPFVLKDLQRADGAIVASSSANPVSGFRSHSPFGSVIPREEVTQSVTVHIESTGIRFALRRKSQFGSNRRLDRIRSIVAGSCPPLWRSI
jgi:hypothetical protein